MTRTVRVPLTHDQQRQIAAAFGRCPAALEVHASDAPGAPLAADVEALDPALLAEPPSENDFLNQCLRAH